MKFVSETIYLGTYLHVLLLRILYYNYCKNYVSIIGSVYFFMLLFFFLVVDPIGVHQKDLHVSGTETHGIIPGEMIGGEVEAP